MAHLAMSPQGFLGRVFGVLMERINEASYRRALEALAPRAGERFLEIGFGTGRFLELLLRAAPGIEAHGVDPTPTMLEVASKRRALMEAGPRVSLRLGHDRPLGFASATLDGVVALHSFQFWSEPALSLREIRRALRPDHGRLVLVLRAHGSEPPAWLPNPLSRAPGEAEATRALLESEGFAAEELAPAGTSRTLRARPR